MTACLIVALALSWIQNHQTHAMPMDNQWMAYVHPADASIAATTIGHDCEDTPLEQATLMHASHGHFACQQLCWAHCLASFPAVLPSLILIAFATGYTLSKKGRFATQFVSPSVPPPKFA